MEKSLSRPIVGLILLAVVLLFGHSAVAVTPHKNLRLPDVIISPLPGSPVVSLEMTELTPNDRVELRLPAGLGEANGLGREWTPVHRSEDGVVRWVLRGSDTSSIALALDLGGLDPEEPVLLTVFSTDPVSGDELQAHWWLVARRDTASVIPAGAERVREMVRVNLQPGAPGEWSNIPRDRDGWLVFRQSDPRLGEVLPWASSEDPYIEATSISYATGTGEISKATDWNGVVFTDWICENRIGLVLQITGAPSDAIITTFDIDYTIFHSVDSSRYKSDASRVMGNFNMDIVPLYNGTESGQHSHSKSFTGLTNWAGKPVNFSYALSACNRFGHEYAYIDYFKITLHYTTGGGGGASVDLVADSVSTDFDTVAAGGQLGYYYDAHVGGTGAVGSGFNTGVYLSSDAGISTSDRLLQTVSESATLSAGDHFGTGTNARLVTVPSDVAPGTYWVGVVLDNGNTVSETNEGNNSAARQITVVASSSKPNLKVSGCSVNPSHVSSGGSVQFSYRAQNTGSTGAAYFSYETFISTDQNFDGSDQTVDGLDVPGGWPAGHDTGTVTRTVDLSGLANGTYYVGFALDVGNLVPETNENDNFCVAEVTVGSGGGGGGGVTHWLIPGAASTTGLNHANWKTQISIVNPDNAAHTVNVYFVARYSGWPGVLLAGPINLSPNQAWFRDDPLASLRPTSGMIYVVADSPGPVVTTRTYNDVTGVGRYGQGIAAEPIGSSCADELILPMVHSGPGQFHTNLGLVQADSGSFTVEVTIYSPGGSPLATKTYTRSGAFDQINNIFDDMGLGTLLINGAWIRVKLTSGCPAHWTTYASVIDESTGDPTYVAPVAP